MNDCEYMRAALQLAEKGCGWVSPNPMVGAVIVKNGQIIGKGYHERYGERHAELNALSSCQESPEGAAMYVTLEPCCHYGKQPPCVNAILDAGITHVIIGSGDPNPLVAGKGIDLLRSHGVLVTEHVLEEECRCMNEIFFHYIHTKHPFVVMKYAMTMDGKIAAYTGESRWITGETARNHVHEQRHKYRAIMTGIGTVLTDDPLLTCRIRDRRNPVRIVCDTNLRTPHSSQIVKTAADIPTIIATCITDEKMYLAYQKTGCRVLQVERKDGHLYLPALMVMLGEEGIDSILLECGQTLNWAALESKIVQKVQAYIAPKLFGGETAKTPLGGTGVSVPADAFRLKNSTITCLDEDFLIESEVCSDVYGNY